MAITRRLPHDLFAQVPKTEDKIDKQEEDILRGDEQKEQLRSLQLRNSLNEERLIQAVQNRMERLKYTNNIFQFVKNYIRGVVVIFVLYQIAVFIPGLRGVPTTPIVTLLGTTSVIVIGLLATVVRHLFPHTRKS